jgi:diaminohydroxyphosphoribosylaminopyrimidine deaminase / 5-amino-6-(5-phosphoribosylamino)uracil reductase
MQLALQLGAGQLGRTGDNPAVGCVIVKDGAIIGKGVTADGGRPHGEAMALQECGRQAQGATVYVTLEPCAHTSTRGPNCAQSLIDVGVERVVCCVEDPDPRTRGKGFQRLREGGVNVEIGLLRQEGVRQIIDFERKFES